MSFVQQQDYSFDSRSAGFSDFAHAAHEWISRDSYFYRPQQPADMARLDLSLLHPKLAAWLKSHYRDGVYRHQKLTIEAAIRGENVISTTPTGSGKTLGFQVPAFHKILSDPEARVMALYPLKALSHDQVDKWHAMARQLGLDPDIIQRFDGSVLTVDRPKKLNQARILLATPDVIHAWFMSNIGTEEVKNFLAGTRLKIVDEVHTYDGVFGTNAMYLFRRLDILQSRLTKNYDPKIHRQYLGASGTLPNAAQNFKLLTDVDTLHIGSEGNGAPVQRQNVFHAHMKLDDLPTFINTSVDIKNQQTVVFIDSRAKVEETTHRIRELLEYRVENVEQAVIPYKSGLRPQDYNYMHELINSGTSRVVISTSALESGIDVDFTFGINLGIPSTKSSLLQRMGRIGRRKESTFIVATAEERVMGRTLYDYIQNGPMETPTLYPLNTSLQLAAAICLRNENTKLIESSRSLQKPYPFPTIRGFNAAYERSADPAGNFKPHERHIIPPFKQKTRPQYHLPLRSQPLEHFTLYQNYGRGRHEIIGDVGAETALREYTPGAIIRHMGEKYRINTWTQGDDGSDIVMTPYNGPNYTRSGVLQTITTSLAEKKIFKEQIKVAPGVHLADNGFIGHMSMRVKSSTTHFLEYAHKANGSGTAFIRPYRYYDDHELAAVKSFAAENNVDYGPKRHISYDTFGVFFYIPERWFGRYAREELGERIVKTYCEKNGISPLDVGTNHKLNVVYWGEGNKIDHNLMVIYERGGNHIGLLEKLPGQLRQILLAIAEEVKLAAETGDKRERYSPGYMLELIDNMLRFTTSLEPLKPAVLAKTLEENTYADITMPEGYVAVLEPYSIAKYARTKTIQETLKVLCPTLNPVDRSLGYWVQSIDRKSYYDTSAKWITVRKDEIGKVVNEQTAGQMRRWHSLDVVNRFVSASYVVTEQRRPTMAISLNTGNLFKISIDAETREVSLSEYTIPDETIRSLLNRPLPKHLPAGRPQAPPAPGRRAS